MTMATDKTTLGLLVGNRGFFPDHLVDSGRKQVLDVLGKAGIEVVCLDTNDTKFGAVETRDEAEKCGRLFRDRADDIQGVLVTLPNFGDERGVADALRFGQVEVPVLIHAFPDDPKKMSGDDRRDSFCGKMSVCNNLTQYGIRYSLTTNHTVDPESDEFLTELEQFAAVSRIVTGLKGATIGSIGTRPSAFKTVRYSEKILEASGISVEVVDLSEILFGVEALKDDDSRVKDRLSAVKEYLNIEGAPEDALTKIAKLSVVIDEWCEQNHIAATAFQCWTSIQANLGICSCASMSMMSDRLQSSACEVDVMGAIAMHTMALASNKPSALLDWNNNFGDDPDKCVMFHCSNLPKSVLPDPKISTHDILGDEVGVENTWGTCVGRVSPGPMTYARLSTDDLGGEVVGYVGGGEFTTDPLETFGGYGVAQVPNLQDLLRFICRMGFEHHVAINLSEVAGAVHEAWANYFGWGIYKHS
ncbi:MAG: fucose isomerase [Armatimonadia bacterium]|nr:fucose isomerase [Armatimonadia bacterium]